MWKKIWNRAIIEKSYSKESSAEKDAIEFNSGNSQLLNYYWNYFELQSTQRNQTCALYFPLLTALITAYVTAIHLQIVWAEYIALTAIMLMACAFGLMFSRTTTLRNNARDRIQAWEKANIPSKEHRLFDGTEETNPSKFTYSTAFSVQFYVVGIVSFTLLIFTLAGVLKF